MLDKAFSTRKSEPHRSIEVGKQALSAAEPLSDSALTGRCWLTLAHTYSIISLFDDARAALLNAQSCFAAAGDRLREADSFALLGALLRQQDKYDEAVEALEKSQTLLTPLDLSVSASVRGTCLTERATIHKRCGNYPEALQTYFAALELAHLTASEANQAVCLNNIGGIYAEVGDTARALECYTESLRLKAAANDLWGEAGTLANIGLVYQSLKDAANAFSCFFKSLSLREKLDDRYGQAALYINLGNLSIETGDYAAAFQSLFKARQLAQPLGAVYLESSIQHALGKVYLALDAAADARAALEHGLSLARAAGNKRIEQGILLTLGNLTLRLGEAAESHRLVADALALAEEMDVRDLIADAHAALANTFAALGQPDEAQAHRQAAADLRRTEEIEINRRNAEALTIDFEVDRFKREAAGYGLGRAALDAAGLAVRKAAEARRQQHRQSPQALQSLQSSQALQSAAPSPSSRLSSPPAVQVEIHTFGAFSVRIDGHSVSEWGRKKARDIFKVLLINYRRAVTVDELIDKLWDGVPARGKSIEPALLNAVSFIRKALEPDLKPYEPSRFLRHQERSYLLDFGDDAEIDFLQFTRLLDAARAAPARPRRIALTAQAVQLYTGDFLKEDLYEDWSAYERETLKEKYLAALESLAIEYRSQDEVAQCIAAAEQLLACDGTHEGAFTLLITLYRDTGRLSDAHKVYRRCVQAFKKEFDAPPPHAVTDLLK